MEVPAFNSKIGIQPRQSRKWEKYHAAMVASPWINLLWPWLLWLPFKIVLCVCEILRTATEHYYAALCKAWCVASLCRLLGRKYSTNMYKYHILPHTENRHANKLKESDHRYPQSFVLQFHLLCSLVGLVVSFCSFGNYHTSKSAAQTLVLSVSLYYI